ncbi:MAG: tRNA (adenosine(37)-N6)-dimethylallyltransferase MiaA [Firmicutes bacterium]|nr:tRNA (adenosine(37)-N6)-dimethylallyltransferase MiaA [Ezakiella sp.]MDD7761983.1 tRNA (adenosine(37)-N6)-dimethylallyltransferase MiaA [Bacillota bacterium]
MNKLIIISGPTGVGKSQLSIELAKMLDGEIISCDSMQIYRHMDIGTAKIKSDEMDGITHHMIDIVDPSESFSVKEYKIMAEEIIQEIYNRNKIPIMVGGTGLYINSIIYGLDLDSNNSNEDIKKELYNKLDKYGIQYIRSEIKRVDPLSYDRIHENDIKRNIRALEYYLCTGKAFSLRENQFRKDNSKYNWKLYALIRDRKHLYDIINRRVDIMLKNGLLDELKGILALGVDPNAQSMQAIGYSELIKYLNNEWDYEFAVEKIKQHSRNYAKRQLTWFRNDPNAKFIDVEENEINDILNMIRREND